MTDERNYANEARAILAGTSDMLPQREHLTVFAAQVESLLKNNRELVGILAGIMIDVNQFQLVLPQALIDHALNEFAGNVTIKREGGMVVVEMTRRVVPAQGAVN